MWSPRILYMSQWASNEAKRSKALSKFEDIKKTTVDDLQAIIGILTELKDEVVAGDLGAVERFFEPQTPEDGDESRFDKMWFIFLIRHSERLDQLGEQQ